MASTRAPKQWCLSREETVNSVENWRQNLIYVLSLDSGFAMFFGDGMAWQKKKSRSAPNRGFTADSDSVPENRRRTAQQKVAALELMLGQIANYCPVIARSAIIKNSTSLDSVWQMVRLHYGFQSTGAHFIDFASIRLEPGERPEDLYQRINAFVEDNLLRADSGIKHHDEAITEDEELSPTVENLVVLTWLSLIHADLPKLIKQRYGTELRSRTIASIKSEISLALPSLLEELKSLNDTQVFRSNFKHIPTSNRGGQIYRNVASRGGQKDRGSTGRCPLCTEANRPSAHFLSKCSYLPESDRRYLAKARQIDASARHDSCNDVLYSGVDEQQPTYATGSCDENYSRRVQVEQSPYIDSLYGHTSVRITLDSGATGNMVRASLARSLGLPISLTKQKASQADGRSPLTVLGETRFSVVRGAHVFDIDGLVVEHLDVDVLGGVPFMKHNDVQLRPSKNQVTLRDGTLIVYGGAGDCSRDSVIRRARTSLLRASENCTMWPGDSIQFQVPLEFEQDKEISVEPHMDSMVRCGALWPSPNILPCVHGSVRLINAGKYPIALKRGQHVGQVRAVTTYERNSPLPLTELAPSSSSNLVEPIDCYKLISVNPEGVLDDQSANRFLNLHHDFRRVFEPSLTGYNGKSGKVEAIVNMGPVQPPQRKGRVPQYSRDKLVELQAKFDELERLGVFLKPETAGVVVEYLNPSFLVKKSNGGYRLVTAFGEVGQYSKPQPSLMPDVNSTLRMIGQWKYIVSTDLTSAFHQIPVSKTSMKYCGVATPFKGVRVYARCAMGMPGSETVLEELMCRVLGDLAQEGIITKIADDLYCGGNTPQELYCNWNRVLERLSINDITLSAAKTVVAPRSTMILGWLWNQGSLSASPHIISTLSSCELPRTVRGLRSFIGAYKTLVRVIPHCIDYVGTLENMTSGQVSQSDLVWTDEQIDSFRAAQRALVNRKSVMLPRIGEELWVVTDAASKARGLGATLYVKRNGKVRVAVFFSAKLRLPQKLWLPCEIEALSIATAVKHFSPYITQSQHTTTILTDSKPCVQAYEKLCRGEFSASPRVSTFLAGLSRYSISLSHLAGSSNQVSDFESRNAEMCTYPNCQICQFVTALDSSVVRGITVSDIMSGRSNMPFTGRVAWRTCQSECADLQRTCVHLRQGTRPSKKQHNVKRIKRYLQVATIAHDGLLVVKRREPLSSVKQLVIIPQQLLNGFLTALHIRLQHPSLYQLKKVVRRYFYALDMDAALAEVAGSCHQCIALQNVPRMMLPQSTTDVPTGVGTAFAADVLKRERQLIFLLRESVTSYTTTCLLVSERADDLRDALLSACAELVPLKGVPVTIRTDPAPGFLSLRNDSTLRAHKIVLETGQQKNVNKNPVAEKAIRELTDELLKFNPAGGCVTRSALAIATASLNARVRRDGRSAREMWTQRDQFTGEALPVNDSVLIARQREARLNNHASSEKSKCPNPKPSQSSLIRVGDVVYLHSEGNKLAERPRYLVSAVRDAKCFIRKFIGSQLRSRLYEVRVLDCYKAPGPELAYVRDSRPDNGSESDNDGVADDSELACDPVVHDSACTSVPSDDISEPAMGHLTPSMSTLRRSGRTRRPPAYLRDYVLE
jgi:hypothetical protein